ncbi:MAG: hypothetical protein ABR609_00235 [Acidimicrobiia bacterium]
MDRLTRWERAELGRKLRRDGWTYSEIMAVLPVVKGTLAGWCREIRLTEEQIDAIRARRPPGVRTGIPVDTNRKRRLEVEQIRRDASTYALSQLNNSHFVAGAVLYWAEGDKSSRRLSLVNTDARALTFFIDWVRTYHDSDAEFVLALHLHEGNVDEAAKSWWRAALQLPEAPFHKTFIKPAGTGPERTTSPKASAA